MFKLDYAVSFTLIKQVTFMFKNEIKICLILY